MAHNRLKTHDVTDRTEVTRRTLEFAKALGGEGFAPDDINDALFRTAYRRIADHALFLDWARDIADIERDAAS